MTPMLQADMRKKKQKDVMRLESECLSQEALYFVDCILSQDCSREMRSLLPGRVGMPLVKNRACLGV